MIRVIDSFMFNGEPIVKLRLKLLDPYVTEFIIVESKITHSGKVKSFFWCDKYAEWFEPYKAKIRFVKLEEVPPMKDTWMEKSYSAFMKNAEDWWKENYQRDIIVDYIDVSSPFILICTDVDEIPQPAILERPDELYPHIIDPVHLEMKFFYYNFQWIKSEWWYHAFLVTDQNYKKDTLSNLRCKHFKKYCLRNAGWHCSYFLSVEDLQRKLESFAHQEFNDDSYKSISNLRHCLETGKDIFMRRGEDLKRYDMTDLPQGWEEMQHEIVRLQAL